MPTHPSASDFDKMTSNESFKGIVQNILKDAEDDEADYILNDVLDIQEIKKKRVLLAYGGPNIGIDFEDNGTISARLWYVWGSVFHEHWFTEREAKLLAERYYVFTEV